MSSFAQSIESKARIVTLPQTSWVWTAASLVCVDATVLSFAVGAAASGSSAMGRPSPIAGWLVLSSILVPLLITFTLFGCYSLAFSNSAEELKRTTTASIVFFGGAVGCASAMSPGTVPTLAIAGAAALVAVPLARRLVPTLCAGMPWWGYPVCVIGNSGMVRRYTERLREQKSLLRPVVLLSVPELSGEGSETDLDLSLLNGLGLFAVIVVSSGLEMQVGREILARSQESVSRVCIQPEDLSFHAHEVTAAPCGPSLMFQMNSSVSQRGRLAVKSVVDIVLALGLMVVAIPVMAMIATVIAISSPGPILYGHTRYGKQGKPFKAWKFRSMVENGDEVLRKHLASDEAARTEWDATRKLRRDPRVTAIGRLLRSTSLDELPQLLNVLCLQMSLVGPRPIVAEEVPRYGQIFDLYQRVPPGITGLWQVSGRNNTTYERRVALDEYYVRNWSVWLDLDILIRTVSVVFTREGAC